MPTVADWHRVGCSVLITPQCDWGLKATEDLSLGARHMFVQSDPAVSIHRQLLSQYSAVMRDWRAPAGMAQGTPERYLISGENGPAKILLKRLDRAHRKRLDRAHRPEPVSANEHCLSARRYLCSHPFIEPPGMLVALTARQYSGLSRVEDFDVLAAGIFSTHPI
jgi:hypothetical protein